LSYPFLLLLLLLPQSFLGQQIASFRGHYDSYREETEKIQGEERAMERNFRKDLQEASAAPIDQDTLKILLQLYKVRMRQRGGRRK